jgi:hypothetical protein
VREAHEEAIGRVANAFGETLRKKATAIHFQRPVAALVTSAFNARQLYGERVSEARDFAVRRQTRTA